MVPKKLRIPTAFSTNLGKALAGNTEEPWRLQGTTNDKKPPYIRPARPVDAVAVDQRVVVLDR